MGFYRFLLNAILALLFLSFFPAGEAQAQDIRDHVTVAPAADWVARQTVPEETFEAAATLKTSWKLATYQDRVSKTERDRYRRFVFDMLTSASVEDNGTLSVSFDPEYQSVVFHHLKIISDGESRDALDLDEFTIYRAETDREKLIFDGRLTASFALGGLKTGDRLDYAYTLRGMNPSLRGGYFDSQTQEFNIPTQRLFARLIVTDGMPVHVRAHDGGAEPKVEKRGNGTTWVTHERDNIPSYTMDESIPAFQYGHPTHTTSSYEDWSEVGDVFAKLYTPSATAEIRTIADDIRAEHKTKATQARAALTYVQGNIRYLALSMGVGGFEPNPPERVLKRRYGDCKDVTLLLLSILKALEIDADPLLVDTAERAGIFDFLPSHTAFDHIVVLTHLDGQNYVMDATLDPQLGDLKHYDQLAYGKGLRLRPGASEVVTLTETPYEWRKDFTDTFDVVSDPGTVTFTAVSEYYGTEADYTRNWVASDGLEAVEKRYLDYYRDFYPTLEPLEPLTMEVDEVKAHVIMRSTYSIPNAWDEDETENQKTFDVSPYELKAEFPKFDGADRRSDLAISYPIRIRQTHVLKVDDAYHFDDDAYEYESDSLAYRDRFIFDKSALTYTETHEYEAKRSFIALSDVKTDMAAVDEIRGRLGTQIFTEIRKTSGDSTQSLWSIILGLFVAAFFILRRFFARKA